MNKALKAILALGLLPKLITSILLAIIGSFIFLVTALSIYHGSKYIETEAEIVDVKYKDGYYVHIYEYETENGMIKGEGFPASTKDEHIIGSHEIISYNPDRPTQFDIGEKKDNLPLAFISIVTLLLSIKAISSITKIYKAASIQIDTTF